MREYTVLYGMSEHVIKAKYMIYCRDLVVFVDAGEPVWLDDNELLNRECVVAVFSANKLCIRKISYRT